jgi:hypothetical protein
MFIFTVLKIFRFKAAGGFYAVSTLIRLACSVSFAYLMRLGKEMVEKC